MSLLKPRSECPAFSILYQEIIRRWKRSEASTSRFTPTIVSGSCGMENDESRQKEKNNAKTAPFVHVSWCCTHIWNEWNLWRNTALIILIKAASLYGCLSLRMVKFNQKSQDHIGSWCWFVFSGHIFTKFNFWFERCTFIWMLRLNKLWLEQTLRVPG